MQPPLTTEMCTILWLISATLKLETFMVKCHSVVLVPPLSEITHITGFTECLQKFSGGPIPQLTQFTHSDNGAPILEDGVTELVARGKRN